MFGLVNAPRQPYYIMLDEHLNELNDVLLFLTGNAEEDLITGFALVERGPGQAIFIR